MSVWYYHFIPLQTDYIKDYISAGYVDVTSDVFEWGLSHLSISFAHCNANSIYGEHSTLSISKVIDPTDPAKPSTVIPMAQFTNCPDFRGPCLVREMLKGTPIWDPERNLNNLFVCKKTNNPMYADSVNLDIFDTQTPFPPPPSRLMRIFLGGAPVIMNQLNTDGSQSSLKFPINLQLDVREKRGAIKEPIELHTHPMNNGWMTGGAGGFKVEATANLKILDPLGQVVQHSFTFTGPKNFLALDTTRTFYKP